MSKTLNFHLKPQECSQWCWAAVTSAIGAFYQDPNCPEQCGVVSTVLNIGTNCCTECDCQANQFDPCNQPMNISRALREYNHDGGDGPDGTALSFAQIQTEINADRPIAVNVVLHDAAATNHAIVIYGYQDDGKLNIADPMQPDTQITALLPQLMAGNSSDFAGTWKGAFRTKR
jgi:hypothetical protein